MSCKEGGRAVAAPSPTALSAQQGTVEVGNETLHHMGILHGLVSTGETTQSVLTGSDSN